MNDALIESCMPMIRSFAIGRYSIAVSGSHGKGFADHRSDVDFRLYADDFPTGSDWGVCFAEYSRLLDYWKREGTIIDGVWMRKNADIDAALGRWFSGAIEPEPMDWAIWGYHLPTDIYNQVVLEDPYGVAEGWKQSMRPYPEVMKAAIIKKYMDRLNYWRVDYHYKSKVERRDAVFLAAISASIVHDIMQVLFALNGVFFPGDGHNLSYAKGFGVKPQNLEERVERILYPAASDTFTENKFDKFTAQYEDILALIDDVGKFI